MGKEKKRKEKKKKEKKKKEEGDKRNHIYQLVHEDVSIRVPKILVI